MHCLIVVGNVGALSNCRRECRCIVSLFYGMSVPCLIVVGNIGALAYCRRECPCIVSLL